jgi:hypothetical protein
MDYRNAEQVLEPGTMKNYYTTQKYIKEFIKERFNTSDKYLSELSYRFITDFEYFLHARTPEKGQKPLNNNGLSTTQIYAKVIESKLGDDMAMLSKKLRQS